MVVQQGQEWFSLPLASLDEDQSANHVNQISTKQMSRLLKRKQVDNAFLGFVQMVKEEESVAEKYKGKSDLGVVHLWREDLPTEIKAVLKEYDDVFPKDLPPGLPPICKGHEFKIELEDDTPPVHRPLYKLSPLELEEAKKQIEYMLEHGFIQTIRLSLWRPSLIRTEEGWRTSVSALIIGG